MSVLDQNSFFDETPLVFKSLFDDGSRNIDTLARSRRFTSGDQSGWVISM